MSEIQPIQLIDVSAESASACGPSGCGCGSAAEAEPARTDATS